MKCDKCQNEIPGEGPLLWQGKRFCFPCLMEFAKVSPSDAEILRYGTELASQGLPMWRDDPVKCVDILCATIQSLAIHADEETLKKVHEESRDLWALHSVILSAWVSGMTDEEKRAFFLSKVPS